jgi:hypothetical protein
LILDIVPVILLDLPELFLGVLVALHLPTVFSKFSEGVTIWVLAERLY